MKHLIEKKQEIEHISNTKLWTLFSWGLFSIFRNTN